MCGSKRLWTVYEISRIFCCLIMKLKPYSVATASVSTTKLKLLKNIELLWTKNMNKKYSSRSLTDSYTVLMDQPEFSLPPHLHLWLENCFLNPIHNIKRLFLLNPRIDRADHQAMIDLLSPATSRHGLSLSGSHLKICLQLMVWVFGSQPSLQLLPCPNKKGKKNIISKYKVYRLCCTLIKQNIVHKLEWFQNAQQGWFMQLRIAKHTSFWCLDIILICYNYLHGRYEKFMRDSDILHTFRS